MGQYKKMCCFLATKKYFSWSQALNEINMSTTDIHRWLTNMSQIGILKETLDGWVKL